MYSLYFVFCIIMYWNKNTMRNFRWKSSVWEVDSEQSSVDFSCYLKVLNVQLNLFGSQEDVGFIPVHTEAELTVGSSLLALGSSEQSLTVWLPNNHLLPLVALTWHPGLSVARGDGVSPPAVQWGCPREIHRGRCASHSLPECGRTAPLHRHTYSELHYERLHI